jgi:hypothetical protein
VGDFVPGGMLEWGFVLEGVVREGNGGPGFAYEKSVGSSE